MNAKAQKLVPPGWQWSCIEEIGAVSLGRQRSPANHSGPLMRSYVRAANITWGGLDLSDVKKMNFDEVDFERFRLREGDVLINEGSGSAAEVGKPAIWRGQIADCCFQNTVLRVQPTACTSEYVFNYIRFLALSEALVTSTQGVNIYHIGREGLAKHPIPVAPLHEQRRIVTKIGSLKAKSERARAHLSHITMLAQHYKKAVLSAAYQGDGFYEDHQSFLMSISEIIDSIDQGWSPKCEVEAADSDTQWAVMKTTAVQAITFNSDENKKLPQDLRPRPALQVASGDVIITRAGPRSRVAVCAYVDTTRPNLMLCDKAYRLKVDAKRVNPKYLTYMLNSPELISQLEELKTGISDSGLNLTQSKFLRLQVPCPSVAMQCEIVRRINVSFDWLDRFASEATSARKLIDRLDQAILSKAFRGELVPQDPNDEAAGVLLERIRTEGVGLLQPRKGRSRPKMVPA